ncbi:hypothetical protein CVT25_012957 [Psilocybe cyanescens]|uniref:Ubiquitin-like protease family profile domain-containing protein n=1 Tax=Psilocybe cyanescens TaxID=93625 RepID=A0A409XLF6_PSICY|nr:hypothetical protein CVT25_012957 [Psilocybe cyanescens]
MASKQSALHYATVIEEMDGSLACTCSSFDQTGKDCVHIKAARLQIAYGPLTDYIELETSYKTHGPKAKGQTQNLHKSAKGRNHQAVSDATVSRDLDKILSKLENSFDSNSPSSTLSPIADSSEDNQFKKFKTPQKAKPVNFSPRKSPIKEKIPNNVDNTKTFISEEQQMLQLDYSHWDVENYMLHQDEIMGIVEVLNSINTGRSGSTLVVPDTYSHFSKQFATVDWIQTDDLPGCTFWQIFQIDPSSIANKKILNTLGGIGAKGLKTVWKTIMVSYLQDSIGLQGAILQDFLSKFQDWKGFPNGIKCIGPRPAHMSHPQDISQAQPQASLDIEMLDISHDSSTKTNAAGSTKNILETLFHGSLFTDVVKGTFKLVIGWINDEIVNIWQEIMIQQFESTDGFNFWVASSFFYPKLGLWNKAEEGSAKSQTFMRIQCFYQKQVNILELNICFFPIHLPEMKHWLLAVIDFESSAIHLLDSWEPTQKSNHKILIARLDAEATAQQVQKYDWKQWRIEPAGRKENILVPCQNNASDCGIFMLTSLTHYMMMGSINNFSNLGDNVLSNQHQILYCNADNVWNLRRYILQLILDDYDKSLSTKTALSSFLAGDKVISDSEKE